MRDVRFGEIEPKLLIVGDGRSAAKVLESSPIGNLFRLSFRRSPRDLPVDDPEERPHLILADIGPLGPNGLVTIRRLTESFPSTPVVAITGRASDRDILEVLRAGARGCLFYEDLARRLVGAIHEALDGGAPMSRAVASLVLTRARRQSAEMRAVVAGPKIELAPRKLEILELLAQGHSYDGIAANLGISLNTVRSHVKEIYEILQVSTKVEAVMAAVQRGLVKPQ